MKKILFLIYLSTTIFYEYCYTQIVITSDELPCQMGTTWTTINDASNSVPVNVGLPGENQRWEFTESIEGIEIKQTVVLLDSTPFCDEFPESNFIFKYEGGLLDLIYSDIFPQIEGEVYFYQQITDSAVCLLGTGFQSSFISGAARFKPPNVILNFLPTQYKDEWTTRSIYSIEKDTTILGVSGKFKLTVNDSAYSIIDAWGKITIPLGEFDCLRMKSYVTMNEQLTFNEVALVTKKARVINYNWICKDYGLIMRATSHTGEKNDTFSDARLYCRMSSFTAGSQSTVASKGLELPSAVKLLQNYPNPFNSTTSITYQIPINGMVLLNVYNLLGQKIKTLVNEKKESGIYHISWNGEDNLANKVPSSIYFYCLEFSEADQRSQNNFSGIRKIIYLK